MGTRKIGKINRKPDTLVFADKKGNLFERDITTKKKKRR